MIWDLYQQHGIAKNGNRLRLAENEQANAKVQTRDKMQQIQDRFDRTVLINEAMWQLLSERVGVTDEQLARRVYELDTADGRADGKRVAEPVDCECGAVIGGRSHVCMFCGAAAPQGTFFDTV